MPSRSPDASRSVYVPTANVAPPSAGRAVAQHASRSSVRVASGCGQQAILQLSSRRQAHAPCLALRVSATRARHGAAQARAAQQRGRKRHAPLLLPRPAAQQQ